MEFYNKNDYDSNGKIVKYDNAKDAFMTKGVDDISLFNLKATYYNKLYAQSTYSANDYGMLQIMPDCSGIIHSDMYAAGGMFIVKYSMPTGKIDRAMWHNPASSISTTYVTRCVSNDGNHLFGVAGNFGNQYIYRWGLSSPWNFGNLTSPTIGVACPSGGTAGMSNCYNLCFSVDGTKMFLLCDVDGYMPWVKSYNLSSPWNISGATFDAEKDLSVYGLYTCRYLNISDAGTSLYVMSSDMSCTLYQFPISSAFDLQYMGAPTHTLEVSTMDSGWQASRFTIDPLFRRMWISGMGTTGYNVKYYEQ